jgi:acetyl esterase/lipase
MSPPELQPDVKAFLSMMAEGAKSPGHLTTAQKPVADARNEYVMMFQKLGTEAPAEDTVVSTEVTVPGKEGPDIHCVAYKPTNLKRAGLQPVIQYMHGGGWTLGSAIAYDGFCRHLCARSGCVVLSVDYRLGPESLCPAGAVDCYRVFEWLTSPSASFFGVQVDTKSIILSGDSAGGNLTCVTALMARDAGRGDCIALQVSYTSRLLSGAESPAPGLDRKPIVSTITNPNFATNRVTTNTATSATCNTETIVRRASYNSYRHLYFRCLFALPRTCPR